MAVDLRDPSANHDAPARHRARAASRSLGRFWRSLSPRSVIALLALVCISLMLIDVRSGPTTVLRSAGAAVIGPLERLTDGLLGSVDVGSLRRQDPGALADEVAGLRAQNDQLRREAEVLREQLTQAGALAAAQHIADGIDGRTVVAKVVAAGTPVSGSTLTIAAGSAAGVVPDSAVLAGPDLIGRVVATGPATATVQLITHPDSRVAVRLASRQTAMAVGAGDPHVLSLELLDPLAPAAPGDRVVTMGSPGDRPFPAGLSVGTIDRVDGVVGDLNRTVTVRLAGDAAGADTVTVIVPATDGAHAQVSP